jgi:hypothetical protein
MSNQLATRPQNRGNVIQHPNSNANDPVSVIEKLIVNGDLSSLSSEQRITYYRLKCEQIGLDPALQPFAYMQLQGKLTLYATKACTQQLCAKHRISTSVLSREEIGDVLEVTARATLPDGMFADDCGCVSLANKRGDDMANARMKAVTKAKRRAVLALCGLGDLDETEVETIKGARVLMPEDVHQSASASAPKTPTNVQANAEELASEELLKRAENARLAAVNLGYVAPSSGKPPKPLTQGELKSVAQARLKRWADFVAKKSSAPDLELENEGDAEKITFKIPRNAEPRKCRKCQATLYFVQSGKGGTMPVNEDGQPHWATCTDPDAFRRAATQKDRKAAPSPAAAPTPAPETGLPKHIKHLWAVIHAAALPPAKQGRGRGERLDAANTVLIDHGMQTVESFNDLTPDAAGVLCAAIDSKIIIASPEGNWTVDG